MACRAKCSTRFPRQQARILATTQPPEPFRSNRESDCALRGQNLTRDSPSTDRSRREAVDADRGLGRLNWAGSAPTSVTSRGTAVRAKAAIRLRAQIAFIARSKPMLTATQEPAPRRSSGFPAWAKSLGARARGVRPVSSAYRHGDLFTRGPLCPGPAATPAPVCPSL